MKELEDKIIKEAHIDLANEVNVDAIFSQNVDIKLLRSMAKEWAKRFSNLNITKVITIESSGIALATLLASELNVDLIIVKKTPEFEVEDSYTTRIYSHQYHQSITAYIKKNNLDKNDRVVIIDDFLSNGWAAEGMISMIESSGAHVVGMGVAVEKGNKSGGAKIRSRGIQLESLSIIDGVSKDNVITFRH